MTGALPLGRLVEADVLAAVDPADLLRPGAVGRTEVEPAWTVERNSVPAEVEARSAGEVRPEITPVWGGRALDICRVTDVVHTPRFGAVVDGEGRAFAATLGGPVTRPELLGRAPGFGGPLADGRGGVAGLTYTPPTAGEAIARIEAGSVFMPWGAGFNYGHFLLDALPGLLALEEAGLTATLPPLAPKLSLWRRQLLELFGGPPVREIGAGRVRLDEAAFPTSMDHYLHSPGPLLLRVRERLLAAAPRPRRSPPRRIYFSRRSHAHTMRIMVDEAALERALVARGFRVVRAEHLAPARQIALVREAQVVVGATGAAMANGLFAPPGALVVDLQPQVFASAWVGAIGSLVGHDWRFWYGRAPLPEAETPWTRRMRRGFQFAWRTGLEAFLPWLDARL